MDDRTIKTIPQEFHKAGYDREEEWFARHNRELILKLRQDLDARRREVEQKERQNAHWMKCPKCGGDMVEHEALGLKAELCQSCAGVYFDHDELAALMQRQEPKHLQDWFKRVLNEAIRFRPSGMGQFPV